MALIQALINSNETDDPASQQSTRGSRLLEMDRAHKAAVVTWEVIVQVPLS